MSEEGPHVVYVSGLQRTLRVRDILHFFRRYGPLSHWKIDYGKDCAYGFIEFARKKDAERCIDEENGRDLHGMNIMLENFGTPTENQKTSKDDLSGESALKEPYNLPGTSKQGIPSADNRTRSPQATGDLSQKNRLGSDNDNLSNTSNLVTAKENFTSWSSGHDTDTGECPSKELVEQICARDKPGSSKEIGGQDNAVDKPGSSKRNGGQDDAVDKPGSSKGNGGQDDAVDEPGPRREISIESFSDSYSESSSESFTEECTNEAPRTNKRKKKGKNKSHKKAPGFQKRGSSGTE